MKKPLLIILLVQLSVGLLHSQTTSESISENLSNDIRVKAFIMDSVRGTPSLIKMDLATEPLPLSQTPTFLSEVLELGSETSFPVASTTENNGFTITLFQQYNHGIKVEHGVFKAISKNDIVLAFVAEYYNLPGDIPTTAGITEAVALQNALGFIGATTYAWELVETLEDSPEKTAALEEVTPRGELVFVDHYGTPEIDLRLAYKFNIYAAEPLSRDEVYVDANTGDILLRDAIIKHAAGIHSPEEVVRSTTPKTISHPASFLTATGDTRYAGNRIFDTSIDVDGNYVLKGITPSGVENETRSYDGLGGLPLSIPALASFATPIADGDGSLLYPETADNSWSSEEHRKNEFSTTQPYPVFNERNNDDIALDAHWGAEVVLDYWMNKHDRFSYDNEGTKIFNFVHYGDAYDNAFWNGSSMTYGDGSYQGGTNPNGAFAPLTSMDVCAHEIGHGVCEFTANLVYQRESGAMNEGFSDIWAAAVENYVLTEIDGSLEYDPFGIGEQIDERDGGVPPGNPETQALRWMDDPKAEGSPDSYGGEFWEDPQCSTPSLANDQCGVHTNSGVLNKWYYLLVKGSGKTFSPGYGKGSADDQVTDAGNTYTVEGLGFEKASRITYLSEVLLSPNAKFADMRETSILVAQSLYGIGSPEEKATTNAWHAVDVGESYRTGEPNTVTFNEKNIHLFSEDNDVDACEDSRTYSILIQGVDVTPSATVSLSTAGSTSTIGRDYTLSATSLTFTGSERKYVDIIVNDDAEIEGSETIVLSFVFNGALQKQEYSISDNDFIPRLGSEDVTLLTEDFETEGFSEGWIPINLSDGTNVWRANGNLTAAGRAYVTDGISDLPVYNQLSPTNTILRSPLLNAAGTSEVHVSFTWEAGGETDAVDPSVIFDYGEFVYSFDGSTYHPVQKFVGGGVLGTLTASGTYSATLNQLDGESFFLGWRWFNDTNAGSEFSFAIDDVQVTAVPAGIETEAGEIAITTVHEGTTVYFLSESDQSLIGKMEHVSADLGCVQLSVIQGGTSAVSFTGIDSQRPSKAFRLSTENATATYDLTLFFTAEELAAFDVPASLIPLKVNSTEIDDADERQGNFQLQGALTDVSSEDGYYAYTGTFSGSGTLSVVTDFEYCSGLPEPWVAAQVGISGGSGEVCYKEGNFEISAAGNGFTGQSDDFHFTYQEFTGDVDIVARISGLEKTSNGSRAALMIREGLEADAKFAMTSLVTNTTLSDAQADFIYRKSAGGKTTRVAGPGIGFPTYIRLVKKGKEVYSYVSGTGTNWQPLGKTVLNLSTNLFVGMAVTSGDDQYPTIATFEQVNLTFSVTNDPQMTEVEKTQTATATSSDMEVYPNPAESELNVHVAGHQIRQISLYNLNGKLLRTIPFPSGRTEERIWVNDLFDGIYILKVLTAQGNTFSTRFVKE